MEKATKILAFVLYSFGTLYYILELTNHWPKSGLISRPRPLERVQPPTWSSWIRSKLFISGYLVNDEIVPIVGTGLLMNCAGVLLTGTFKNVLFLDMIGTAFCSFMLGPWYGALCGLVSNSFVNYVMYPGPNPEAMIFPWSLVNMVGGLYWGFVARGKWFRNYLSENHPPLRSHLTFVVIYGVLASILMSLLGAFIQVVVGDAVVLQNSEVSKALSDLIQTYCAAEDPGLFFCQWFAQAILYMPDKAISVALAVTILRLAFPLYERELIHIRPNETLPRDGWLGPLALALAYVPSFIIFTSAPTYRFNEFYWLWSAPWLIFLLRMIHLAVYIRSPQNLEESLRARTAIYDNVLKVIRSNVGHNFYKRLRIITILSSLLIIFGLPFLQVGFYPISGNFGLIVCGLLLSVYTLQLALGQNALVSGSMATVSAIQKDAVTKTLGEPPPIKEPEDVVKEASLSELPLYKRGKVRHLYEVGDQLLIVASDRIPVLDREINITIPQKGATLTKLSAFWFTSLKSAAPHHFLTTDFSRAPFDHLDIPTRYRDRAMLVSKLDMINYEFIVRGYLAGSAWEEYSRTGQVAGIALRLGLEKYARLEELIFTPTTKTNVGPEAPVSLDDLAKDLGTQCAEQLKSRSLALFKEASEWCEKRGLILCDTKFEYGWKPGASTTEDLLLADEIFTPDSSRFFKAPDLGREQEPPSWDKDIVANYLRRVGWAPEVDPSPEIPTAIVSAIANRYEEIYSLITKPPAGEASESQGGETS